MIDKDLARLVYPVKAVLGRRGAGGVLGVLCSVRLYGAIKPYRREKLRVKYPARLAQCETV